MSKLPNYLLRKHRDLNYVQNFNFANLTECQIGTGNAL